MADVASSPSKENKEKVKGEKGAEKMSRKTAKLVEPTMSRACHVPFVLQGTFLDGKDKHESGTTLDRVEIEYSVHTLHPIIERHCKHIFPGVINKQKDKDTRKEPKEGESSNDVEKSEKKNKFPQYPLLCIPTFQHTNSDMLEFTESAEKEKDLKLKGFYAWCQAVCQRLRKKGFWADYIDPCSGYPVLGDSGSSTYNEVEGMQLLLRYRHSQVGMCKVILHPRWGQRIYPASMFSMAPLDEIKKAIKEVEDTYKEEHKKKDQE
mmetsp:Transcript_20/g.38  ORF Transcript_20/g.38 Transcript_20/m.38 type:complete len:264 (+) Transcript_20:3-794(+)